jgi:hypothetical protein
MFFALKARSTGKAAPSTGKAKRPAGPAPDCAIWNDISRALGQSARVPDTKAGRR